MEMLNLSSIAKNRLEHKINLIRSSGFILKENPLASFIEECIQSGMQFETSKRAELLDNAIDFCMEKELL